MEGGREWESLCHGPWEVPASLHTHPSSLCRLCPQHPANPQQGENWAPTTLSTLDIQEDQHKRYFTQLLRAHRKAWEDATQTKSSHGIHATPPEMYWSPPPCSWHSKSKHCTNTLGTSNGGFDYCHFKKHLSLQKLKIISTLNWWIDFSFIKILLFNYKNGKHPAFCFSGRSHF